MFRLLGSIIFLAVANVSLASSSDERTSWFKPVLMEGDDPVCGKVLIDARQSFLSGTNYGVVYGSKRQDPANTGATLDWKTEAGHGKGEISAFGKIYYLDYLRHPGCGGACETNQPLISDKPFPEDADYYYREKMASDAPPATSDDYTIARSSDGDVFLRIVGTTEEYKGQILIYRLAKEGRWQPVCKVATAPENVFEEVSSKDEEVVAALKSLQEKVYGVMGGAGDCGTSRTHGRWRGYLDDALKMVLYRPWVLPERNAGVDVDGSYDNDMKFLAQWSLLGIDQYKAFRTFQAQIDKAIQRVAIFYRDVNGWSQVESERMATQAIRGAVSVGVRFYMYEPGFVEGEESLRKAILEKRPMDYVRTIQFDAHHIDDVSGMFWRAHESNESILSVAVEYPEALNFLLQSGVVNDHPNDFGKTPLMYAAQNSSLEAAKLLIEAGANVNAVTTKPMDTCYYTLQTHNVTPLHYAVRYSSPELITLLLDSGAKPFVKAAKRSGAETPLDWLRRYTATDAAERNPNISEDKIGDIEKRLVPLSDEDVAKEAEIYRLKAEKAYQAGDVAQAYREIALALELRPDDQLALADMSLIALRNDKLGESNAAADRLLKTQASDKIKASAWFNQGLACEKYKAQGRNEYLAFNGTMYCTYGILYPYINAYALAPTRGRRDKIRTLFDEHLIPYCEIPLGGSMMRVSFQSGANPAAKRYQQLQTLYVLHESGQHVTEEELAWNVAFSKGKVTRVVPKKVASLELDDEVLSVFETSATYVQFPYLVFGKACTRQESTELPGR